MTDSFNEKLLHAVAHRNSHLCVGLDPDESKFSEKMRCALTEAAGTGQFSLSEETARGSEAFFRILACEQAVLAASPSAAAFKPNAAFFEGLPQTGRMLRGLSHLVRSMCPGSLAICDVKRGDIGNTAEQYAQAVFSTWDYDAATINPLMGHDAVEPFLRRPDRGVFLLCLTSNPGAHDFLLQGELYLRIAERAVEWNSNGNVGLVVGATRAEHAAAVRSVAPDLPFLIPGVGAQGGALDEILDAIDARDNPRFLINASRSIMYHREAAGARDLADQVAGAAAHLRDEIESVLAGRS